MNKLLLVLSIILLVPAELFSAEGAFTWKECVILAEQNNPELESAGEKVKMAETNIGIARSPMLPDVSVNSGASRSRAETQAGEVERDQYSYGIEGRQMIFDGMKTPADVDRSKEEFESARYRYLATSSNVRLNLRNSFIAIMKAQENIKISERIVDRRRQNYDLVKLRYEAGREHKGSLLTAEADYSQAKFDLGEAQRDLSVAWKMMKKAIGLADLSASAVEADFSLLEEHEVSPDFNMIAQKNPLLDEMIHLYEASKYNVKSSKLNFFPTVYGFLSIGKSNDRWPPDKTEWSAGLQATLPLFEGGRRIYETKKAIAEENYYKAEVKNVRESVLFTLQQKWMDFQSAVENVGVKEKYLIAAEERSKIAEAQYGIGLVSFDNWVIIENTFVQALKNFLNARTSALSAEAEWVQARGETLEYDKK